MLLGGYTEMDAQQSDISQGALENDELENNEFENNELENDENIEDLSQTTEIPALPIANTAPDKSEELSTSVIDVTDEMSDAFAEEISAEEAPAVKGKPKWKIVLLLAGIGVVACALGILAGWLMGTLFGNGNQKKKTNVELASLFPTTTTAVPTLEEEFVGVWEASVETAKNGKSVTEHWVLNVGNAHLGTVLFTLTKNDDIIYDGVLATIQNHVAEFSVPDAKKEALLGGTITFTEDSVLFKLNSGSIKVKFTEHTSETPTWHPVTTTAEWVYPYFYEGYWFCSDGSTNKELAIFDAGYIDVNFSFGERNNIDIDCASAYWVDRNKAEFIYHDGLGTVKGELLFVDDTITMAINYSNSQYVKTGKWVFDGRRGNSAEGLAQTTTATTTIPRTTADDTASHDNTTKEKNTTQKVTTTTAEITPISEIAEEEIEGVTVKYISHYRDKTGFEYTISNPDIYDNYDEPNNPTYFAFDFTLLSAGNESSQLIEPYWSFDDKDIVSSFSLICIAKAGETYSMRGRINRIAFSKYNEVHVWIENDNNQNPTDPIPYE